MRFSRDKRGYENTFVVHAGRRRGKSRPRVLYWFRTPPGVRVGRAALDEDAIRLIEEHNPEIEFNWTQILKSGSEVVVESPAPPPAGDRQQQTRRPKPARQTPSSAAEKAEREAAPEHVVPEPAVPAPETGAEDVEPLSLTATLDDYDATLAGGEPVPAGGMDDFESRVGPPAAAAAHLGAEGLLRLRARYAEILARISERVPEPARQEELKGQAERLNPDTWVTEQEVRDGLERYEAVFESLRAVVGHKRTRRRRRGGRGTAADAAPGSSSEPPAGKRSDSEGPEGDGNDG